MTTRGRVRALSDFNNQILATINSESKDIDYQFMGAIETLSKKPRMWTAIAIIAVGGNAAADREEARSITSDVYDVSVKTDYKNAAKAIHERVVADIGTSNVSYHLDMIMRIQPPKK